MGLIKDTVSEAIKNVLNAISKYNKQSLGLNGAKYVIGSGANAGDWFAVQGVNAAVIDCTNTVFKSNMKNFSGSANIVIPNGSIYYINATDLRLSSGSAIIYSNNKYKK